MVEEQLDPSFALLQFLRGSSSARPRIRGEGSADFASMRAPDEPDGKDGKETDKRATYDPLNDVPSCFRRTVAAPSQPAADQGDQGVRLPHGLPINEGNEVDLPDLQEPTTQAEALAQAAVLNSYVPMSLFPRLCDLLPTDASGRSQHQQAGQEGREPFSFTVGAFVHGGVRGLRTNTKMFPWVAYMLASFVRSCTNEDEFSSISVLRNVFMPTHSDRSNCKATHNFAIPVSSFSGGGIWVEDGDGDVVGMDGVTLGRVHRLQMPGARFSPLLKHHSQHWTGDRIVVIAYHISGAERLLQAERATLSALRFRLQPDAALSDLEFESEADCGESGEGSESELAASRDDLEFPGESEAGALEAEAPEPSQGSERVPREPSWSCSDDDLFLD